ncbi:MAG: hypothetical protein Ta2B_28760 [Termitinemataceae bacterium]|nr:MAG: hypothetical protein Ta2B_28760 [Termitinemataceae bacterium]
MYLKHGSNYLFGVFYENLPVTGLIKLRAPLNTHSPQSCVPLVFRGALKLHFCSVVKWIYKYVFLGALYLRHKNCMVKAYVGSCQGSVPSSLPQNDASNCASGR